MLSTENGRSGSCYRAQCGHPNFSGSPSGRSACTPEHTTARRWPRTRRTDRGTTGTDPETTRTERGRALCGKRLGSSLGHLHGQDRIQVNHPRCVREHGIPALGSVGESRCAEGAPVLAPAPPLPVHPSLVPENPLQSAVRPEATGPRVRWDVGLRVPSAAHSDHGAEETHPPLASASSSQVTSSWERSKKTSP